MIFSQYTALGGAPAANDLLLIDDVSDTSMAATGTTKVMTITELFASGLLTTAIASAIAAHEAAADPHPGYLTEAEADALYAAIGSGVTAHGDLDDLELDQHTQYALLAGRAGGQTLTGGTGSGDNLALIASSHGTPGKVINQGDGWEFRLGGGSLRANAEGVTGQFGFSQGVCIGAMAGGTARGFFSFGTVLIGTEQHAWAPSDFAAKDSGLVRAGVALVKATNGSTGYGAFECGATDAVTNSLSTVLTTGHNSSGTPAAGFGLTQSYLLASSTTADQQAATVDVLWATATHATRKARWVLSVYDTAAREVMRGWADGAAGRIAVSTPASAPDDAQIANGQVSFYLDEATHKLHVRVKYSDGTLKIGEVALT